MFLSIGMLKQKYFLTDIFILSAEKQPIKLSWRKIECLRLKGNRITTPYRELSLKECTVRVLGRIYCEITKQEPLLSETEWIQLHVLMGLFKRMNIQNHISDNILHITRSMLKKNNYTLKEQKSNTFTTYIYSLSKTSTRYKVIKNFFV